MAAISSINVSFVCSVCALIGLKGRKKEKTKENNFKLILIHSNFTPTLQYNIRTTLCNGKGKGCIVMVEEVYKILLFPFIIITLNVNEFKIRILSSLLPST